MSGSVARNQSKLNKEGIESEFGDDGMDETASKRFGYPVQAHHCICCSVMQKNNNGEMAKLAIDSGYDINNGDNNIFLPARFGHMRRDNKQRHRGGHCQAYYDYVDDKLNPIYEKFKDEDPCNDDKAKKKILGALNTLQKKIYNALDNREVWLYSWSEVLYNQDYKEEGPGDLKKANMQGSSSAGLEWVVRYPGGTPRRKMLADGSHNVNWYTSKGYPPAGSVKS